MTRPGGPLSRRPLHFIWLADTSGSMSTAGKIQSLNNSAREALPSMRKVARENPNAEVFIRVATFSEGARWIVEKPTPLDEFSWPELSAVGYTDLGDALRLVAAELRPQTLSPRALPPVIVLLSDGYPTDDFEGGLRELMDQQWGAKSVRIAIAIGRDVNLDVLRRFIGDPRIPALTARNPDELGRYIRWASTTVLSSVSLPKVETRAVGQGTAISMPDPLPMTASDMTW